MPQPDPRVENAVWRYNRAVERRDDAERTLEERPSETNRWEYIKAYNRWLRAHQNLVEVRGF